MINPFNYQKNEINFFELKSTIFIITEIRIIDTIL